MPLAHLRNTINSFFGRISALFCALAILLLGALLMPTWVNLATQLGEATILDTHSKGHVTLMILLIPNLYSGVAFGRFLLRAMPPRRSGNLKLGVILITIPATIACAVLSIFMPVISTSIISALDVFSTAITSVQQANVPLLVLAIYSLPFLTWWGGVIIPVYRRWRNPDYFVDLPFILFLRRFSNFSDRAVINLILRQAPLRKPVVFLTPTRSRAQDWNPFLIGFAGMKLLAPFDSVPIFLRCSDDQWIDEVEFLVLHAHFIVFDISEGSAAIESELAMIHQIGCWPRTIFLKHKAATEDYELEKIIKSGNGQTIYYRKSWIRAIPRVLLGFIALMFTYFRVMAELGTAVRFIGPFILSPTAAVTLSILIVLFELLSMVCLCYWFFMRPSIDRMAKMSLRRVLGQFDKVSFQKRPA